jgi:hypothetical protein
MVPSTPRLKSKPSMKQATSRAIYLQKTPEYVGNRKELLVSAVPFVHILDHGGEKL